MMERAAWAGERGWAPAEPVRRRRRGGALRALRLALELTGLAALALGAWLAWRYVGGPEGPRLDRVEIAFASAPVPGAERILPELRAALEPLRGRNLLRLDLREACTRLEAHPRIASASVRRRLPDTLEAEVVVREAAGRVRIAGKEFLVDAGGLLLAEAETPGRGPVLGGLDALEPAMRPERIAAGIHILREIEQKAPSAGREAAEMDLSPSGWVVLRLRGGAELLVPLEGAGARVARWWRLRREIAARVGQSRTVDLRWDGQIAVRPASAGGG